MKFLDATGLAYFGGKIRTALSAKQDKLTGSPGQLIGIDGDGTAKVTVYLSNKNLLDNWYFAGGGSQQGGKMFPINQRGKTIYSGNGAIFDRWRFSGAGTTELTPDGIKITVREGYNLGTLQMLDEGCRQAISGKTVTLSFLTTDNLYSFSAELPGDLPAAVLGNLDTEFGAIRLEKQESGTFAAIQLRSEKSPSPITVIAAKLELGDTQTLAHRENGEWVLNAPPPNYALELAECQRYYYVAMQEASDRGKSITGFANCVAAGSPDNKTVIVYVPTPAAMRANPAIEIEGYFTFHGPGGRGESSRLDLTDNSGVAGPDMVRFSAKAPNMAEFQTDTVLIIGDAEEDTRLAFSAEL